VSTFTFYESSIIAAAAAAASNTMTIATTTTIIIKLNFKIPSEKVRAIPFNGNKRI
jgi:hypothetical protein